jgi:large subunit ribosomal protein L15
MINNLQSPKTTKARIQIGRGIGSGKGGHTVGRGTKGQKSRSGYTRPRPGFEGGQMPLSRRLPTLRGQSQKSRGRGFAEPHIIRHVFQLSEVVEAVEGDVINNEALLQAGLIRTKSQTVSVKVVFDQPIAKAVTFEGIPVSAAAKAAIEKAGGKVA